MSDAPQGWDWSGSAEDASRPPYTPPTAPPTSPPTSPPIAPQPPYQQAPPPYQHTQPYQPQLGSDTPLAWYAVAPPGGAPAPNWVPPQPARRHRTRRSVVAIAAAALVAATALGSTTYAIGASQSGSNQPAASSYRFGLGDTGSGSLGSGSLGSGSTGTDQLPGSSSSGSDSSGSSGTGDSGSSSTGSSSTAGTGDATAQQSVGVVDINTTLDFGTGAAAGTGVILTADGTILTNNHVVEGSTSIKVTVVSTGKTYTAKVVGTSPTQDIAVLQLENASGLQIANLGDSSTVQVGDSVTGVGNAGGDGGAPSASPGSVTALDQSITATDESGSDAENLTGLIEVDADIRSGDSGGPLYDADTKVVGIDTAASSGRSTNVTGYAIPINKALSVAKQILDGTDNATIHQGYPAFLGVQLSGSGSSPLGGFSGTGSTSGATIAGVVDGSGADQAGLGDGDTITAIGSTAVSSADVLSTAIAQYNPGDRVSVSYTDADGTSHTATVTLSTGPAD